MGINQVVFDNRNILDITSVTVDIGYLLQGKTAHKANGNIISGEMDGYDPTPVGISVVTPPTKTEYEDSDTLDLSGIKVVALLSNGFSKDITNSCVFDPANGSVLSFGTESVEISYRENGATYSTSQAIHIKDALVSISVISPTKTVYDQFDSLNLSGCAVTARYASGRTVDVTADAVFDPTDGSRLQNYGTIVVSVSYTSDDITVQSSFEITVAKLVISSFASATDLQLAKILDAYYNNDITWEDMGWAVGDTRKIHLNSMTIPTTANVHKLETLVAQDITVVIVAHNHTDLATPINGHTKACITVQTREGLNGEGTKPLLIYVNGDSVYDKSFSKWSNLYMRTYMNSTLLEAFTYSTGKGSGTSFKSMIKPSKHYRHTAYNTSASELVTDTLFLPSYPEVFGTASYGNYVVTSPVEGTQFDYYKTASNRKKYPNNNGEPYGGAQYWWEGSTSASYNTSGYYSWLRVSTTGTVTSVAGNNGSALLPAWAM